MIKFWNDMPKWQQGAVAILFFISLGFGIDKTFVMAGEFKAFVQQEETNWLIVDRRDYESRILAMDLEWKDKEMPPATTQEYWRMKNELKMIYEELDARREERKNGKD